MKAREFVQAMRGEHLRYSMAVIADVDIALSNADSLFNYLKEFRDKPMATAAQQSMDRMRKEIAFDFSDALELARIEKVNDQYLYENMFNNWSQRDRVLLRKTKEKVLKALEPYGVKVDVNGLDVGGKQYAAN